MSGPLTTAELAGGSARTPERVATWQSLGLLGAGVLGIDDVECARLIQRLLRRGRWCAWGECSAAARWPVRSHASARWRDESMRSSRITTCCSRRSSLDRFLPPITLRGRGLWGTMLRMLPYVAYTAAWNYTGQPAASVPAGFDDDGLPLAIHLVGRPNDEATPISLAAQLEAARPWDDRRPPLACGLVLAERYGTAAMTAGERTR